MDRMTPPQTLQPDRLSLALDRELKSGERVLWEQRQIARVSYMSFGIYLFAIPWTAFSLFWTAMAAAGAASMDDGFGILSWAFPLFGVPFIVVGLGMLGSPFLPLWNKGKVLYAITNERLIKLKLGRTINAESVPARRIGAVKRTERRDGSGTLGIVTGMSRDNDGDLSTDHFVIENVADVLRAQDLIEDLAARA
ncbi:hypothetical protein [Altererythrobacter lutimaris]|uniref:PH domain-containing protein n=1 Tax=Altererythrobacter lutimaris TaxID=2743979 RepID=A0A850HAE9_9SPHN|nr:hypothetical protein [Altererythrobacter lutimaris]NVE93438.1 hypothetical protein [Altererythrobacter lutimaris]